MTSDEEAALAFRLEQLELAEKYLEEGLKSGTIPKRAYSQGQVAIAHDYIMEHKLAGRAMEAIRRCDPDYFLEPQREDMARDPRYAQIVIQLATALVALGLVETVPMPAYTQPLGQA